LKLFKIKVDFKQPKNFTVVEKNNPKTALLGIFIFYLSICHLSSCLRGAFCALISLGSASSEVFWLRVQKAAIKGEINRHDTMGLS